MSAGRTMQDALREAARENQALAFLVGETETERAETRRAHLREAQRARRAEVSAMEKQNGGVPEKTPEKTPEEPGALSGGEQSNGPVKG